MDPIKINYSCSQIYQSRGFSGVHCGLVVHLLFPPPDVDSWKWVKNQRVEIPGNLRKINLKIGLGMNGSTISVKENFGFFNFLLESKIEYATEHQISKVEASIKFHSIFSCWLRKYHDYWFIVITNMIIAYCINVIKLWSHQIKS